MSTTVGVGGFELTSNHETSESMLESLAPTKEDAPEPKLLVDEGKPVESEEPDPIKKAASDLGKRSAEARAKAAKEKPDVADAGDGAESEKGAEKPLGKPKDDPRARVAEATRAAKEAREEAERNRQALAQERAERARLAQELEQARAARQEAKPVPKAQPQYVDDPDDPRPKDEDFQDYSDLIEARAQWATRQAHRKLTERTVQAQQEQQYRAGIDTRWGKHIERITKAGGEDFLGGFDPEHLKAMRPTFSLGPGERPGPINVITDEIVSSEHGPAMMVYFRDNPEDFQRIAALGTPLDVAKEMAKLEYRLSAATAGTSAKAEVSRAKPPVRPVTGAPNIAEPELTGDVSFDDFARRRAAQKAKASR